MNFFFLTQLRIFRCALSTHNIVIMIGDLLGVRVIQKRGFFGNDRAAYKVTNLFRGWSKGK